MKLLLDTNVLSEFMRPAPSPAVIHWLDGQSPAEVWTSAISRAEIELGLALLPAGKRRQGLTRAAQAMFDEDFAGRCLPFDEAAATWYAQIVASRKKAGRPVSVEDGQIASIAMARGLVLATRNLKDFSGLHGLQVVNPWQAGD